MPIMAAHKNRRGKKRTNSAVTSKKIRVPATDFSSKSVLVKCQLEQRRSGPTSHRKQSLQNSETTTSSHSHTEVLFTQVNHHNSTVRRDALVGLKDIFSVHPHLIPKHLATSVEKVLSTMVDSSGSVRQACFMFVKCFSSVVDSECISPFFPIMVAHLNCGLTHIKEKIRLDSLKVLEVYIQYYSQLLVTHVGKILPIMIGPLSRHKEMSPLPHPKMSSKKLNGVITAAQSAKTTVGATLDCNPSSGAMALSSKLTLFNLISKLLASVLSATSDKCMQAVSSNVENLFAGREQFLELASTLVVILMECWVECHPSDVMSGKTPLPHLVSLLQAIMNTLSLVLKLVLRIVQTTKDEGETEVEFGKLCRIISGDLNTHVLSLFPFKMSSSRSSEHFLQIQYDMNFAFCEVSMMNYRIVSSIDKTNLSGVHLLPFLEFLSGLKQVHLQQVVASAQSLLACTNVVVGLMPLLCELSHQSFVQLNLLKGVLAFIWDFYKACHPHSKPRWMLIQCFCKVLADELAMQRNNSVVMVELLLPWSSTLLDLLLDLKDSSPEVSALVLDSVSMAAAHKSSTMISELQHKLLPLLSTSSVFASNFSECTQRRLVELVWHIQDFSNEDLGVLSKYVLSSPADLGVKQYLIQIVHHKYCFKTAPSTEFASSYLSFMITVLVGCVSNDVKSSDECCWVGREGRQSASMKKEDYKTLRLTVCECLKASSLWNHVLPCLEEAVLSLKVRCPVPLEAMLQ